MQTRFTSRQLADPEVAASEQILRKCVHCGFCTATCPTYVLLGDELDSPRGRIYLIKEMLENDRPATADVVQHIDRCLSCLACMTTCPSGVHYQHLIDHARMHVERTFRRPWFDRALRSMLAWTLPYPVRFRFALALAAVARPFAELLPAPLQAMLALTPRRVRTGTQKQRDQESGGRPGKRARVAVLTGCVQAVIAPQINSATIRLLRRAGAEVIPMAGCCGAIVHHLGREADSKSLAASLVRRLHGECAGEGLDAIVVSASGCGTQIKDFGHLLQGDPQLAEMAATVAARTRDVTEIMVELGLPDAVPASGITVAYHSACSMQHGQMLNQPPRALLAQAGYDVKEIPEGHLCCGSAGTYNLLQPEIANRLRARKLANVARVKAQIVATGNIGCISQLSVGADIPIVHTVELLDWATGGPMPAAIQIKSGSDSYA
jgi:glycolate oxidase iron-sulfur subunit